MSKFNLLEEIKNLDRTMTEVRRLPEEERIRILLPKMKDILERGKHTMSPRLRAEFEARKKEWEQMGWKF